MGQHGEIEHLINAIALVRLKGIQALGNYLGVIVEYSVPVML